MKNDNIKTLNAHEPTNPKNYIPINVIQPAKLGPYAQAKQHVHEQVAKSAYFNFKDRDTMYKVYAANKLWLNGPIDRSLVMPRKENDKRLYKTGEWTLEEYKQWFLAMNPAALTIDEIFIKHLILGTASYYMDKLPEGVDVDKLFNERKDPAFITWATAVFGYANKHETLLKSNNVIRARDLKELEQLTRIEQINTDPTRIQIPVIYPSSYYRVHYPIRRDGGHRVDKNNRYKPIWQMPKQNIITSYPELIIFRCELMRVNPHLIDKFKPLRVVNAANITLHTLEDETMLHELMGVSNEDTKLIDSIMVAKKKNRTLQGNSLLLIKEFSRRWHKVINKAPRSTREIFRDRILTNINDSVGLLYKGIAKPSLRKKTTLEVVDKMYEIKGMLENAATMQHISVLHNHRMQLDLDMIFSTLHSYISVIDKT